MVACPSRTRDVLYQMVVAFTEYESINTRLIYYTNVIIIAHPKDVLFLHFRTFVENTGLIMLLWYSHVPCLHSQLGYSAVIFHAL